MIFSHHLKDYSLENTLPHQMEYYLFDILYLYDASFQFHQSSVYSHEIQVDRYTLRQEDYLLFLFVFQIEVQEENTKY